jgi:hypothetical protein
VTELNLCSEIRAGSITATSGQSEDKLKSSITILRGKWSKVPKPFKGKTRERIINMIEKFLQADAQ